MTTAKPHPQEEHRENAKTFSSDQLEVFSEDETRGSDSSQAQTTEDPSDDREKRDQVCDGDCSRLTPLLTAKEVGEVLRLRTKAVYGLLMPRVELGSRRHRWRQSDVQAYIDARITDS